MIRPHFVALAAGAILALGAGTAEAARAKRTGRAPVTHASGVPASGAPVSGSQASGSHAWHGQSGQASYYGKAHHGKRTASGARFDQNAMTAAHSWLPFGTRVKVTHVGTGRSVIVTINDRLPSRHRVVDLSYGAAQNLGIIRQGVVQVTLTPA